MKYIKLLYPLFFLFQLSLQGQNIAKNITGQVTFLTSQNIYVRFSNTGGINVHDTLYISSDEKLIPVLVVNSLSSTSCMCSAISGQDLPVGHLIIAKARPVEPAQDTKTLDEVKNETPAPKLNEAALQKAAGSSAGTAPSSQRKQRINGSLSAASYSDFSNTAGTDVQRFRYTLSLDAVNIADSRLSAETYISFRHKAGDWGEVKSNIFNALKIYSLALRYDIDSTMHLKLGRQLNPRISSIGSFDGLSVEKSFGGFTLGLAGGSRPDYLNYGFDPHLLQYGAYMSYDYSRNGAYSGTSLAFMEQLNSGKTDRRFLYFQHSSSLAKSVSLFSSFEMDVFKLKNDKPASTFDLTSLFMSLNFRISNNVTISGSYDARKNPVYYESFKTLLDTLMENALRQSLRLSSYIRINSSLMLGIQSSWRFLKTDLRQSKNISGYLTYSHPGDNYLSVTLSGNYIETSYINGYNAGIALSNSFQKGKVQTGIGYNYQDYRIPEGRQNLAQHTARADLYWQASTKTSLSVNYEVSLEKRDIYNRLYIQIRQRF